MSLVNEYLIRYYITINLSNIYNYLYKYFYNICHVICDYGCYGYGESKNDILNYLCSFKRL